MTDENTKIHWLRLQKPIVISQLAKKDAGKDEAISWKMERTGRIGFRFYTNKGIVSIDLYEEVSYKIDTNFQNLKALNLHIDDARDAKLIDILHPGIAQGCDEREKLIMEVAETAADNNIVDEGLRFLLWRFLVWATEHDVTIRMKIKQLFPEWIANARKENI